VVEVQST